MSEKIRRIANIEKREAEIMQIMLWEKILSGDIDMESYERMTNQMRRHEFVSGRYTEQLYKL